MAFIPCSKCQKCPTSLVARVDYEQTKKFDPNHSYIKKWVPEYQELTYVKPIVEHVFARNRVLDVYKKGLNRLHV
jgi:hypothetical protein